PGRRRRAAAHGAVRRGLAKRAAGAAVRPWRDAGRLLADAAEVAPRERRDAHLRRLAGRVRPRGAGRYGAGCARRVISAIGKPTPTMCTSRPVAVVSSGKRSGNGYADSGSTTKFM